MQHFPAFGFESLIENYAPLIFLLLIWTLIWKGLALWHSARRGDTLWFIVLLVVNTAGVLEIAYLFVFAKMRFDSLFTAEKRPIAKNDTA